MVSRIDIDFKEVMQQAKLLDEIADQMRDLSEKSFYEALENIALNWKGENANLYLNKGDTLKENMTGTAQELKQIAEDIKKRARHIYSKEQHAIRIAARREY